MASGLPERPYPRRSGTMTWNPAPARAGTWCRQSRPESGKPCSSTTGGPSPVTSYSMPTPSTSTRANAPSFHRFGPSMSLSRACSAVMETLGAQRPERRPDLGREQLGLLPGGEVAALAGLIEVGEGGVGQLDPAARGPEDLVGERGEADRDRDLRRSLPGRERLGSCALPVRPGRRGPGAGQPVHGDVVEDVVPGEAPGRLPVDEGAGDLVVRVGVVVEHPGRQGEG